MVTEVIHMDILIIYRPMQQSKGVCIPIGYPILISKYTIGLDN